MSQTHLGFRVLPLAQARRLYKAINAAAGYPRLEQGVRICTDVRTGVRTESPVDVLSEALVGLVVEPGGTRGAVQITDVANALHGLLVPLPDESPAELTIDTRTGRTEKLPPDWQE